MQHLQSSKIAPHINCKVSPNHSAQRKCWSLKVAASPPLDALQSRQAWGLAARAVGRTDDGQMAGVSRSNATAVVQAAAYGQQGPTIAVLSYRDRPEVAQAAVENIAAAFQDDPSTTYFCRPERRVQYYRSILSCLLDWYPEDKQLVCTLPPDAAAFVHVFPRLRELDAWTKLRRGALVPLGCVRLGRLLTGMDASSFFEGQREDFVKVHGPFLYVSVMAVRPDRQGCGLGSALLAFVCDRADAAGMYCYIEATSLRNRALYERFGFKLILEWRSEPNMPYTYILARPPSPLDSRAVPADTVPEAAAAAVVMTRAADAAAHLGGPGVAAAAAAAASAASAAAATAAAAAVPWRQMRELRLRRFAERRRQQRQRRRRALDAFEPDGDVPHANVPYSELDESSWWPLAPDDEKASAKEETEVAEGADTSGGGGSET